MNAKRLLPLFGVVLVMGMLAASCESHSYKDDVQIICDAASQGQVASATSAASKKQALVQHITNNIKTNEGRAFAQSMMRMKPDKQLDALAEAAKTTGVDINACATHTLIKELVEASEE